MTTNSDSHNDKKVSKEEVVHGFDRLIYEQRNISSKISEIEQDLREHKMVMKVLQGCEPDRAGFRLIEGVLVEGKVKDILPAVEQKADKMLEFVDHFKAKLDEKTHEIETYKHEHKIRIAGDKEGNEGDNKDSSTSSGIIVS